MALPEYPMMDVEDYLILDRNSKNARYEYLDGELRMLAGGSRHHGLIIANLTTVIGRLIEDSPCLAYSADVRLQLSESRYVYPDLTINCDQRDEETEDEMIHYPTVVIEVLSPSTVVVDKGKKLNYYLEHPTIQEYMMVDSLSVRIEVYHREEDGWKYHVYGQGDEVTLESLAIRFPIKAVYRGTNLTRARD